MQRLCVIACVLQPLFAAHGCDTKCVQHANRLGERHVGSHTDVHPFVCGCMLQPLDNGGGTKLALRHDVTHPDKPSTSSPKP